jgi:Bacteriophage minor capsid protein
VARSPAEFLRDKLASVPGFGTVGGANGWRLGCGAITDSPDTQVVLTDSPGEHPDPKWLLEYPYVQTLVRGSRDAYSAPAQKAKDAYDILLGIAPFNIPEGRVDGITGLGGPNFIGNDSLNRPLFSTNFRLIFEPAASPLTNRAPL